LKEATSLAHNSPLQRYNIRHDMTTYTHKRRTNERNETIADPVLDLKTLPDRPESRNFCLVYTMLLQGKGQSSRPLSKRDPRMIMQRQSSLPPQNQSKYLKFSNRQSVILLFLLLTYNGESQDVIDRRTKYLGVVREASQQ
jgi:hypothetical protein